MKVIAINGSPHPQGNTFHALKNIGEELKKETEEDFDGKKKNY